MKQSGSIYIIIYRYSKETLEYSVEWNPWITVLSKVWNSESLQPTKTVSISLKSRTSYRLLLSSKSCRSPNCITLTVSSPLSRANPKFSTKWSLSSNQQLMVKTCVFSPMARPVRARLTLWRALPTPPPSKQMAIPLSMRSVVSSLGQRSLYSVRSGDWTSKVASSITWRYHQLRSTATMSKTSTGKRGTTRRCNWSLSKIRWWYKGRHGGKSKMSSSSWIILGYHRERGYLATMGLTSTHLVPTTFSKLKFTVRTPATNLSRVYSTLLTWQARRDGRPYKRNSPLNHSSNRRPHLKHLRSSPRIPRRSWRQSRSA